MMTLKIALRNILRHRTRTIITVTTIVFGCTAIIFAGGFFEDIFYKLRESYIRAHTGHIQIYKTGFLEKGGLEPFNYMIENPQEIISNITSLPGIEFVAPRIQFAGLLSTGENTISFLAIGADPKYEHESLPAVKSVDKKTLKLMLEGVVLNEGVPLAETDTYKVILGKGLAAAIDAHPGDSVVLLTNTTGGSVNALDVTVQGVFYTSSKDFDDHFLRLPLSTAQKLLCTDSVQSLVVLLNKTDDTQKIKSSLIQLFKEKNWDLEIKTWNEVNDFYNQTVKLFNRLFLILKTVIIIIVILSIFNTMNMAVFERISEIGTIMALGAKREAVLDLFVYEGLCLGTIGGAIGVVTGIIITTLISQIGIHMPPPPGSTMPWISEPKIVFSTLVFAFVLAIITSFISSLYPAYKASSLEIADALRHK